MKRKYIIISVITILIVGILSISLVVYHNKQQHMYDKMADAFFKAAKQKNNRPDEIKKHIKDPNKENSSFSIYAKRDNKQQYYIKLREVGIDAKSPLIVKAKGKLQGKTLIVPEYDAAKIKYRGYTSYYLVDKAANFSDVKLVNKTEFTHHKKKRLFSLNNFNVKKAKRHVEIVKKLDMPTLQSNKKLLYATIIYYGISNLPIERWQELADKSSGWQVNALPDGRKLVWSGKNITDDEKQLPPNYFKLDKNGVDYRSFIIHSNNQEMSQYVKTDQLLQYANQNPARIKQINRMATQINVE
ncbi:hypothetical protein [Weissella bombi]|uniref:Uncharacterized protein n=1 Tax=Weissella bombi TaxID=1505725 RepID=A0A1C3YRL2_9LACO|nr:hypothetical protein [Weissella bombi]SCB72755.1 hypothetical protein GA0061074_10189 [Weissella bombi]